MLARDRNALNADIFGKMNIPQQHVLYAAQGANLFNLIKMQQLTIKRWKCKVCGYIHEGNSPPDICPVCGAPKEDFEEYDY